MENQDQGVLEVEIDTPAAAVETGIPGEVPGTLRDGKVVGAPEPAEPKPAAQSADPDDAKAQDDGWKQRARRNERRAQKAESQVARLIDELSGFKKRFEVLEQGQTQVQQQTAAQHEQAVDAAYQTARAQLFAAKQAGDVEAELSAQERFLEAKAARDWVNFNKVNGTRQPQQQRPQPQPQRQAATEDKMPEAAQEWLSAPENAWFKTNPRLKRIAMAISDEVLEEGIAGDDPEHYAEVTRRMKEDLGDNFAAGGQPQKQPGRQPVTGVNRTATPPGNRIQITEAHRLAARQAGIDLNNPAEAKAFAAQLAQTQARLSARGLAR